MPSFMPVPCLPAAVKNSDFSTPPAVQGTDGQAAAGGADGARLRSWPAPAPRKPRQGQARAGQSRPTLGQAGGNSLVEWWCARPGDSKAKGARRRAKLLATVRIFCYITVTRAVDHSKGSEPANFLAQPDPAFTVYASFCVRVFSPFAIRELGGFKNTCVLACRVIGLQ